MLWKHVVLGVTILAIAFSIGCTEKKSTGPKTNITYETRVVRDVEYLPRIRFDLGRLPLARSRSNTLPPPEKLDFFPGFPDGDLVSTPDSIIKLIVFLDDINADSIERFNRIEGRCYIDPEDTLSDDPDGLYRTAGYFEILGSAEYYFDPREYYIQFLNRRLGMDDILAVYMEVKRWWQDSVWIDTIGDLSTLPYRLKLIKPQAYLDVNNHIWEYQWRSFYSLGFTESESRNLEVDIYKGTPISNTEQDPADVSYDEHGVPYIQILGLDQGGEDLTPPPDGVIDRYAYIDPVNGLLLFPIRHPFDSKQAFLRLDERGRPVYPPDSSGTPLLLSDAVPEIYLSDDWPTIDEASEYYVVIRRPVVME